MTKIRMKMILAVIFAASVLPMSAETILKCDFNQWGHGWYTPPYYGGKTAFLRQREAARTGAGALHIQATEHKGDILARAIVHPKIDSLAGRVIKMQGFAKGTGDFFPGFTVSTRKNGKLEYETKYAESPLKLSDEYQSFEIIIDLSRRAPTALTPELVIRGQGEAFVDDLLIESLVQEELTLTAPEKLPVVNVGNIPSPINFKCSRPEVPVRIFRLAPNGELEAEEVIISDKNGMVNYLPTEPAAAANVGVNRVVASAAGVSAVAQYEVKSE